MLLSNKTAFTLTFLVYAVFANDHIHQRDHSNLKRFLRKRAPPQSDLSLVAGAGAAVPTSFPPLSSASDTASESSSTLPSSTSLSVSISTSHSLPVSTESSTSASSSTSETTTSASETSSSTSISSQPFSTSTTSTPTPSVVVVTNTSEQAPVSTTPVTTPTSSSSKGIVTLTQSVDASQSPTVVPQTSGNTSAHNSTALTALIVVASSVAAIAILWTVFRKWKLGHSSKFDERLQPIDWRPTTDDDRVLPAQHRRHSGASSFRSAGHLPSSHGHGSSDHGHGSSSSYTLPDHDFTAGPSHLAPVGGYADLARGPSPQPQMNQASGAALTRPAYGFGVPQGYAS